MEIFQFSFTDFKGRLPEIQNDDREFLLKDMKEPGLFSVKQRAQNAGLIALNKLFCRKSNFHAY